MIQHFKNFSDRVGLHTHVVLLLLLFLVGGVWGFVALADEVGEGDTLKFDNRVLLALRHADDLAKPIGPAWLEGVMRDLTALGGVTILSLVTLSVIGYLALARKYHAMLLVAIASAGAFILSSTLKHLIARPRPTVVPHLHEIYTSSFPSGHSMMSSAVYLTLGSLLARFVPERAAKIYLLSISLLTTFLVGLSRVYLGVHYPTDVLAGWTAGLAWALLCWLVARYLQKQGAVEKDDERR